MCPRNLMWCGLLLGFAQPAIAQSNIDPANKFAWGENVGWTNWSDADNTNAGVRVEATFLSGYIWAENVGWIHVGAGPLDGFQYTNFDNTDYGVNRDPLTNELFGYAWGENIGWVNFDTRSKGVDAARLDPATCRFLGYAWSENTGWLNLNDATHYVAATSCIVFSVTGIQPTRLTYDSQGSVTVTGQGFSQGSGHAVLFDGVAASSVTVVDDSTITCQAPLADPGQLDVDVTVTSSFGSDTLPDAFTFTPALFLSGDFQPGGDVTMDFLCDPGDSLFVIYGPPPPINAPTPPYDGALCVAPFFQLFLISNWPFDTFGQTFPIPNDPSLSGATALIQALVGSSFQVPKDGAWTNCGVLTIQ